MFSKIHKIIFSLVSVALIVLVLQSFFCLSPVNAANNDDAFDLIWEIEDLKPENLPGESGLQQSEKT